MKITHVLWQSAGMNSKTIGYVRVENKGKIKTYVGVVDHSDPKTDAIKIAKEGGSCCFDITKHAIPVDIKLDNT